MLENLRLAGGTTKVVLPDVTTTSLVYVLQEPAMEVDAPLDLEAYAVRMLLRVAATRSVSLPLFRVRRPTTAAARG